MSDMNESNNMDSIFWHEQLAAGRAVREAVSKDDLEALLAAPAEALWVADVGFQSPDKNRLGIAAAAIRNGSVRCLVAIVNNPLWIAGRCSNGSGRKMLMREVFSAIESFGNLSCATALARSSRALAWDLLSSSTPKKELPASGEHPQSQGGSWGAGEASKSSSGSKATPGSMQGFVAAVDSLLAGGGGLALDCDRGVANRILAEALAGEWRMKCPPAQAIEALAAAMISERLLDSSTVQALLSASCEKQEPWASSLFALAMTAANLDGDVSGLVERRNIILAISRPSTYSNMSSSGQVHLADPRAPGLSSFSWDGFFPEKIDARWVIATQAAPQNIEAKLSMIRALNGLAGSDAAVEARPTSKITARGIEHPLGPIWDIWENAKKAKSALPEVAFMAAQKKFDKIAMGWSRPEWASTLARWTRSRDLVLGELRSGLVPERFCESSSRPSLGDEPIFQGEPLSPLAWARSRRQLSPEEMACVARAQSSIGYRLADSVDQLRLLGAQIDEEMLSLLEVEVLSEAVLVEGVKKKSMRV